MERALEIFAIKLVFVALILAVLFAFKLFSNPDFRHGVGEHFSEYVGVYVIAAGVAFTIFLLITNDGDQNRSGPSYCYRDWDGRSNPIVCTTN